MISNGPESWEEAVEGGFGPIYHCFASDGQSALDVNQCHCTVPKWSDSSRESLSGQGDLLDSLPIRKNSSRLLAGTGVRVSTLNTLNT